MASVVLVITMNGTTDRYEFAPGTSATVGRSSEADIVLDDQLASREHATFHFGEFGDLGGVVELEDLGSQNGTSVLATRSAGTDTNTAPSSRRVLRAGERTRLEPGCVVQVGVALITLDVAGRRRAPSKHDTSGVVLEDEAMLRLYDLAERVAASDLTVLVLGESGVGKEVLARHVHQCSERRRRELLSINCGALTESLLEAELFGYEKGAFTGAAKSTKGLIESADGGTLFLDEVGELPPSFQVKLLRVLEDQTFMRVGGRSQISANVRFIAATNRNLPERVASGEFREDLYYRLNGISLTVPPLRSRLGEILPLAKSFIKRGGLSPAGIKFSLTAAAREKLEGYDWPGNVRQLRNVIRRAVVLAGESRIDAEHIQLPVDSHGEAASSGPSLGTTPRSASASVGSPDELRAMAESVERQQIIEALEACAGNQTRAAKKLGLTRRAFGLRLIKYDIPRPRK